MSTHATTVGAQTVPNPGRLPIAEGVRRIFFVCVAIGVAAFAAGLAKDPVRAWVSFLHNHFFFMSLALGGTFFVAIQWATNAMWSAPVRRLAEGLTAYLPVALVSFVILTFGMHDLYSWTHPEHVKGDILLEGKAGYLNVTFFIIRDFIAIALWWFFSKKLVSNSVAQDSTRDFRFTQKNRVLSVVFLMIFTLTYTMVSFDQLMSLDPHWFSTMFGVYCFSGLFYSVLALICLLTVILKKQGKLDGIVNDNHLHDLGKFMFAFTVFYAYIGFSQFMLIWYANLPEETGYFLRRMHSGWMYVTLFLLLGKFLTPFFLLMPRGSKRQPAMLAGVAIFMLVAQWIDFLWIIQPEFYSDGPVIGMIEIGLAIGFVGVFGIVVQRFLSKNTIVAIGDPRLEESVFHHHQ